MAAWGRSIAAWARAAVGPDSSGTADGELLTRFAVSRDQAAFELLVWRHGGMVFRTALAVTRDHHAAEDVAQATFLVLAKRAGSLRHGDAVAGFLHTTARRMALRVASRRRGVPLPEGLAASPVRTDDVSAAVHEEVARLPEVWRVAVLLCFFEGLTHAEAAERLGKPVGSVAGWIARAKARLEDRLTRRGVTLPAAGLASLLAVGPADAKFVAAVSGGATAYVSGSLVSSPVVLQLVHGAYRAMILAKLKVAATAGVIALGGAGLTVGGWAYTTAQVPLAPPAVAAAAKPARPAEELRRISLAQMQRSQANLKMLVFGMHGFATKDGNTLPSDIVSADKAKKPLLSWRVAILPYIGEEKLYAEFKLDQPWDSEANQKLLSKMPDCLRVGFEAKGTTDTYYQVTHAPGAALYPADANGTPQITRITDGTSNTIGVVECGPPVPWTKPADIVIADLSKPLPQLAWPFKEAIVVAMMDGSARAFGRNIPERRLRDLITAAGDEVIDYKLMARFRLPATTAEEKARIETARTFLAAEVKALQSELAENLRLMQKDAEQDYQDYDELARTLNETRTILKEKNKELAAPKK